MRMAEFVGELVRRQRQTGAASEAVKPTSTQKGFDGFCLSYSQDEVVGTEDADVAEAAGLT